MATYKQAEMRNVPISGSEFQKRFSDGNILSKDTGANWIMGTQSILPWGHNSSSTPATFPAFNFNQMSVKEFFQMVTDKSASNPYKGMLERIGRTIIWADDLMDNPFLRFMKPPLSYGDAIEQAALEDIHSRQWNKNYQSTDTGIPNPLFKTELPKYLSEVATVNFSREIPLKMSEIEYRKCCQTAETVGDVAGALIGKINVTFIDDMYEACKQYFCGCLRIAPEPLGTEMPLTANQLADSPMIDVIDYKKGTDVVEDKIFDKLHEISDTQFAYKSTKYNPAGRSVLSKKSTLILPKKWKYQLFLKKYAETYHPEHIMLGDEVDLLYVDEMPKMFHGFAPSTKDTQTGELKYEYLGLLVDNRALGITPLNGGFSVESFYNPSENSTSYFGHYEMIFSFASLFNRKYIFLNNTNIN